MVACHRLSAKPLTRDRFRDENRATPSRTAAKPPCQQPAPARSSPNDPRRQDDQASPGVTLLSVSNLTTVFRTGRGEAAAIEDVSFDLAEGEILGLVGESGSGKSVTALTIMGLLPSPPARVASGQVLFQGQDLLRLSDSALRRVRGPGIAMVFQEPMTSLNPVFTIGDQVMETIAAHERLSERASFARAVQMLEKVGIPSPASRMEDYPHQLSGGQRQRVMLAIALACRPKLLIAD